MTIYDKKSGFALIATLSIMLLIVLLLVAMLSLATSTTRSQENGRDLAEAQANAKLALKLAIGELQKQMGPDQRISANGDILGDPTSTTTSVIHPNWTGVWDSWIAGDLASASVNPDYPSGESHNQTIGAQPDDAMHPDYANKDKHFRRWLLSLDPTDAEAITSANSLALNGEIVPSKSATAIRLVGGGSLGNDAGRESDYVSARLLDVSPPSEATKVTGRYGWWVGDESQKSRIMADSYNDGTGLSDADRIFRAQAPGSMGSRQIPGMEGIVDEQQLDDLPSFKTLDLVEVVPQPGDNEPAISQRNFHDATIRSYGVLADVREGGLKRDLSTILERDIQLADSGDEFMLYRFSDADERVPIQDLAAYYQLYRDEAFSAAGRGGIKYSSGSLSGRIQADVPDYGTTDDKYLRQYTALYRNPVPVKIQFVLGIGASLITAEERAYANAYLASKGLQLREEDKYKLSLGVKPVVSLWNPNNVPLVMDSRSNQELRVGFPPFVIQWKKFRAGGADFFSNHVNLNYAITNESTNDGRARYLDPFIIKIQYARTNPIVFEPGEIKTFTVDIDPINWLENDGKASFGDNSLYDAKEFLPDGFYVTAKVAPPKDVDVVKLEGGSYQGFRMVFADGDKITYNVTPESKDSWARAVARGNEIVGGGFQFYLRDRNAALNTYRNYQFISRFGQDGDRYNQQTTTEFNAELILAGFPDGEPIDFDSETDAMPGASGSGNIKSFTDNGAAKGLIAFTMMPGSELNNQYTAGFGGGRKIMTRPFTHGSILSAPQIADNSPAALYEYGWEWQVEKINDTEEVLQDDGQSRGFYGGGYNFGSGSTHVVQQYLPVLPPISIASLSSAHLGGYSLANNPVAGSISRRAPEMDDFRQITATGQGGLAPHTLQAIGNSYAHPNIPANQAYTSYTRRLNMNLPAEDQEISYADHSYLANKALWDDYFFSSISPQYADVQLQQSSGNKTAFDVAREFLFDEESLPNRRISPYLDNLISEEFDLLEGQYGDYTDGFADKIASHLMIKGPFNVNSTSVGAWKVLLTSMRDKAVAYLNETSGNPASAATGGQIPVAPGMLPNDEPVTSGQITASANNPAEQWTAWRSLSDAEIDQLATAIVYQVKQRGPFLSLSEFINRRLDAVNIDMALKGALQAAIDFEGDGSIPEVTINSAFRSPERSLDVEADKFAPGEFEFSQALDGPVAYGSTPYLDQADILRQLGSVLTPRGDTFVIRAYGDKLDARGNVIARAWCEAVVQRTPDYVNLEDDENHFAQARLSSEANKAFGREFKIVSFRWLKKDEI